MNILFVLYGDFTSNSVYPLSLYARELHRCGHSCAVAVPHSLETVQQCPDAFFRPLLYADVLNSLELVFPDRRPADVVHAWTPRENVRRFVTSYMVKRPTPLIVYLEDHEFWISCRALGLEEATLTQQTDRNISERLRDALSHPFRYDSFIGLADAVVVIQDKLTIDVPPWVYCETVMPGVDLEFFSPRVANPLLRKQYGVAENERVIVYPGGLNEFTKPAIETLCRAVGLINNQGYRCKLLRTGPFALDFIDQLPPEAAAAINDLGVLPRSELPNLLALADVFVQPGKIDPFEDLRLPGKLPEFLAMGRPVVMPDVNISHLFSDGVDVVLTQTGSAEEIAAKCIDLFSDFQRAERIGQAGRLFAEKHFDLETQARRLANVYKIACDNFSPVIAKNVWRIEDENTPVTLLLARKLKMLADSQSATFGFGVSEILKEHARYIELMHRRVRGLEAGMAERDWQIVGLSQTIAERNGQIAGLDRTIAERDRHIAESKSKIASHEERALEQDQQLKIAQALYAQMASSTSWRISLPLREAKRFLTLSPEQQAKRYVRGGLRLARRMYQAFPLSSQTKEAHRDMFAKYLPRLLLISGSHPEDISELAASEHDPVTHHLSSGSHEGRNLSLPDLNDYSEWVRRYDTLTEQDREKIKMRISQLHKTPLISVVMPVYNPPLSMLEDAIRSVQGQLYPNWELCIADDASTDVGVHKLLQRCAKNDSRIKVVFREKNGHISATSNSALELVNGEYVALLDNDDLLSEHALFWVADAIVNNPDAGLIYSDEDKIDQSGLRFTPYFKSDWNPDLFLSHNMISHLGVYRTDLVKKLGGFREGYEGSQDYDLALRCTEQLAPRQIVHIPRVLYHWRSHPGSTALAGSEKNYALLAGERALNDHFARTHISARAELLDFGMYRARYAIPSPVPLVSLIIPTHNGLDLITQCIESIIARTTYKNYEILVVDNNSDDPDTLNYFASIAEDKRIRILRDERPFNYSALNNAAAEQARGEYLGLINNDIEVISPEWLEEMMGLAIQPGVGAVGARLWYPNDTLQHGGVITGIGGIANHSHKNLPRGQFGYCSRAQLIQTFSAVTAACLVVKKSVFHEMGGLDEANLKVAFNDVDFCLRVREAGYRNVWTPYAELYHHESATRGYDDTPEKQLRASDEVLYMQKRWGDLLMNDPAYSPNLTLDSEDFSLAWPPRVETV